MLDYRRVKKSEREAANKMFSGSKGDKLLKEIANTFVPGGELDDLQKRKFVERYFSMKLTSNSERKKCQLRIGRKSRRPFCKQRH